MNMIIKTEEKMTSFIKVSDMEKFDMTLETLVNDIDCLVNEAEDDKVVEYLASLDEEIAEEISENEDITMAIIKIVADRSHRIDRDMGNLYNLTYFARKGIKTLADIIMNNKNVEEYVGEVYLNFADELDYRLSNGDFEDAVELILIEEVINR